MIKSSLSLLVLMCSVTMLRSQDIRYVKLRNEAAAEPLKNYHITAVKDDRADTTSMGTIRTGLLGKKTVQVNLEKGAATALQDYVTTSFRQNLQATPVEIHIAELTVKEQPGGIRSKIETTFVLAFWVNGARVTDYRGFGTLEAMVDLGKHIGELTRQNVLSSLRQFDDWWGQNRLAYEKNSPVSLSVEMVATPKDSTQIAYQPQRLLAFNDFLATPDEISRAAAQTASAMTLRYASRIDSGRIQVHVQIAAYFDKTRSWFGTRHRTNEKILTHEQRHFDITALKACEMADTLRGMNLTKDNYEEMLERVHAQKQRELDTLQLQYDTETRHGTLAAIQDKWNKLLQEMLSARSCFKTTRTP